MTVNDEKRKLVRERAKYLCEYCHDSEEASAAQFAIDHIVPRSLGGSDNLDNLALACQRCNGYRYNFTTGIEPQTQEIIPLFNPRQQKWSLSPIQRQGKRVLVDRDLRSAAIAANRANPDLQAIAHFGSINMLINNAGIFALGPVEEFLLNFIRTHIIERTIFRGKNEQDWSDRYNLVNNAIHNPILEKPEDVAAAIWKAVKYQQYDMLVGSARLSKAAYQLFPGLMLRLYQRLFGMRARHYRQ